MRLLDRYIWREVLPPFGFGLAIFTVVLMALGPFRKMVELVAVHNAPLPLAFEFLALKMPYLVALTLPMAVLLACLLAFGRLSGDGELVAMLSSGIGFLRVLAPVLFFSGAVGVLSFADGAFLSPRAERAAEWLKGRFLRGEVPSETENLVVPHFKEGRIQFLTFARRFEGGSGRMEGVVIVVFGKGRPRAVVVADEAVWRGGRWWLKRGFEQLLDPRVSAVVRFKEQAARIEESPEALWRSRLEPEWLTLSELLRAIRDLRAQGVPAWKFSVHFHLRFAIPLVCLLFALVGATAAVRPQRTPPSLGAGLAVTVIFAYYLVMNFCMVAGERGLLPPALAAWTPDVLTFGGSLLLLRRIYRR